MALYWLNETVTVRRLTYTNDKATFQTVFTNVLTSVQDEDVPVDLRGEGYASRTYTVYMDLSSTIYPDDLLITTDGRELKVTGVKTINAGFEPHQEISCEEAQD